MTDTAPAVSAAVAAADLRLRVRQDQLQLFLSHWRGSLAAITLATAALVVAARDIGSSALTVGWGLLACTNYGIQAVLSWRIEQAPELAMAMPGRLRWLMGSVTVSGLVWGLMPWVVWAQHEPALLLAVLFDFMLMFAVVNTPTTRGMLLCAVLPVLALTTAALWLHGGLGWQAVTAAGLCGVILTYGLRVQAAVEALLIERHTARDLADALGRQQQRLVALEGERTRLLERQRLMHDLHDGMGSTLTSTLIAVEHGQLSQDELSGLLRDCVNDLRAVVDSLDPINLEIVSLLAAARFRIGPQLQRQGIVLDWDMQELPSLPWFGPSEALQVMRLVQEMIANVVRHAAAHRVQVQAKAVADGVAVHITDDGQGFEPERARPGRGLRAMAHRAGALGGTLDIRSAPGEGTRLRLFLPLQREAARAPSR